MTDFSGTEEPTHTDDEALGDPLPIIPVGPGAAGVALPAVIVTPDALDGPSLDAEPQTGIDEDEPDVLI